MSRLRLVAPTSLDGVQKLALVVFGKFPEHDTASTLSLGPGSLGLQRLGIVIGNESAGASLVQAGGLGKVVVLASVAGASGGGSRENTLLAQVEVHPDSRFVCGTAGISPVRIELVTRRRRAGLGLAGVLLLAVGKVATQLVQTVVAALGGSDPGAAVESKADDQLARRDTLADKILEGVGNAEDLVVLEVCLGLAGVFVERSVEVGVWDPGAIKVVAHDLEVREMLHVAGNIVFAADIVTEGGTGRGDRKDAVRTQGAAEIAKEGFEVDGIVGVDSVARKATASGVLPVNINAIEMELVDKGDGLGDKVGTGGRALGDVGEVDRARPATERDDRAEVGVLLAGNEVEVVDALVLAGVGVNVHLLATGAKVSPSIEAGNVAIVQDVEEGVVDDVDTCQVHDGGTVLGAAVHGPVGPVANDTHRLGGIAGDKGRGARGSGTSRCGGGCRGDSGSGGLGRLGGGRGGGRARGGLGAHSGGGLGRLGLGGLGLGGLDLLCLGRLGLLGLGRLGLESKVFGGQVLDGVGGGHAVNVVLGCLAADEALLAGDDDLGFAIQEREGDTIAFTGQRSLGGGTNQRGASHEGKEGEGGRLDEHLIGSRARLVVGNGEDGASSRRIYRTATGSRCCRASEAAMDERQGPDKARPSHRCTRECARGHEPRLTRAPSKDTSRCAVAQVHPCTPFFSFRAIAFPLAVAQAATAEQGGWVHRREPAVHGLAEQGPCLFCVTEAALEGATGRHSLSKEFSASRVRADCVAGGPAKPLPCPRCFANRIDDRPKLGPTQTPNLGRTTLWRIRIETEHPGI